MNKSPLPIKTIVKVKKQKHKLLNFHLAIDEICNQAKVTRAEWKDEKIYCFLLNNQLAIHTDSDRTWIVSFGDIMGDDWYVI